MEAKLIAGKQVDNIVSRNTEEIPQSMKKEKVIGIVGGMGPMASLDLCQKILNETNALNDQDHLPVILLSAPHLIQDRTSYLLGKDKINPAIPISKIIIAFKDGI